MWITYWLMIVVLLFAGCLGSPTCVAASEPPELRVGSEIDFPPYAVVDENGRPAGFSVDLIQAVADVMGLSIRITTGPWDTVWSALVAGQLDVLPIVAKLPERRPLVDFSLPHTETYDAFFVRNGTPPIQDIEGAKGKEIVVMRSDAAHHALLERNFQGRLIPVGTIPEGLSLISSGKHHAFLCSKLIGTMSIDAHGLEGLNAGPPIPDYKRVFSFAVKKGDNELLERLNQGLLIIKTSGEYDRIYEKWLIADDPWRNLKKYLLPAIAIVSAMALIVGIWLVMLQLLVRKRTHELAESNEMLRLAQEGLEERVALRTAELAQANAALQAEITERKQAEESLRQRTLELQQLTQTLEQRVRGRTRELEEANEVSRHLSTRLLLAQEEERKRIAGEIHDTLGSCLSAIKFKVEDALQHIGMTPNAAAESLNIITPSIQEGIEQCRRIQMDLRPSMLDDLGLLPTLSWFCRRFQAIYSTIRIEQETDIREEELPIALKIVIYRIAQEAMNNIAKHSKADRVRLCLRKNDGRTEVVVEDNGQGFDVKKALALKSQWRGLGLTSMRERVELSGGSFAIESAAGQGTVIRASWPLRQSEG